MSNFIKRAVQQVAANVETHRQMAGKGLYVPDDLIAGRHFGGFAGYTPWVQDCIRAACKACRNVPPEELAELSALVMWTAEGEEPTFTVDRHRDVLRMFDTHIEWALDKYRIDDEGLLERCHEQIRRAEGTRTVGTFLVLALQWKTSPAETVVIKDETGLDVKEVQVLGPGLKRELWVSVSCWNPASVEEAEHVPKQAYLIG